VIHELKGFVYYLQQIPSYYYGEFTNRLRSIENELRLNGEKIEDEVVMKKLGVKRNTLRFQAGILGYSIAGMKAFEGKFSYENQLFS